MSLDLYFDVFFEITAGLSLALLIVILEYRMFNLESKAVGWTIRIGLALAIGAMPFVFSALAKAFFLSTSACCLILDVLLQIHGKKFVAKAYKPVEEYVQQVVEWRDAVYSSASKLSPPNRERIEGTIQSLVVASNTEHIELETAERAIEEIQSLDRFCWFLWKDNQEKTDLIEAAESPFLATQDVRDRIKTQLELADNLRNRTTRRADFLQNLGIGVVLVGMATLAGAIYMAFTGGPQPTQNTLAIAGVAANLVGATLTAFHRISARAAVDFYDRQDNALSQLTALELAVKPVVKDNQAEIIQSIIENLVSRKPNI